MMEATTGPPPPPLPKGRPTEKGCLPTAGATISDLPTPIICEILSRLPLQSIFRSRRVCITWRNLLLERYFTKLHLSRSSPSLILHHRSDCPEKPFCFIVLELEDPSQFHQPSTTMKFKIEIPIPHSRLQIVGSCNGLICLADGQSRDTVLLCNPLESQYLILPKYPLPNVKYWSGYGFGYCPLTGQYKVVRFAKSFIPSSRLEIDIYALGKGSDKNAWRSIGDTGQLYPLDFRSFVFANGAIHWLGKGGESKSICYIDIETEQVGNFPLPSHMRHPFLGLGVVDNSLYLIEEHPSSRSVNIWLMKEYGNVGSLTVEWVIEQPILPWGRKVGSLKPIKTLKDGAVLTTINNTILMSYNPETRVLETIKDYRDRHWAESVFAIPSFISLRDML